MEQIWLSRAISKLNQHWIFNFDISRNHKIYHPCIGQNEKKNDIKSLSFLAWGSYWFCPPWLISPWSIKTWIYGASGPWYSILFGPRIQNKTRIWNLGFLYFFGSDPRPSTSIETRNLDFKRFGSKILNWIFPNYDNFSSVRFRSFERHSFE